MVENGPGIDAENAGASGVIKRQQSEQHCEVRANLDLCIALIAAGDFTHEAVVEC